MTTGVSRRALSCAAGALLLGAACSIAQGPLPGDLAITGALQAALGTTPPWALAMTETAKMPWLAATLTVAVALEAVRAGWRGALGPPVALLLALALDALLRLVLFAPRPSADLVAVASASASSGLPSTFGLFYGALFGAAACLLARRRAAALAASSLAAALLVVGACARVVLGGHWSSQVLASLLLGAALGLVGLAAAHAGRIGLAALTASRQ